MDFASPQASGFATKLAPEYEMFLRPGTDRAAFIQTYLGARGVDCAVISVEGKRHIYVKLPRQGYDATFRVKTIIAHYDIVAQSPGANDNSSSVFCLMDFAARLAHFKGVHNCRIFFTDGEELGSGGVQEQGAFSLASTMQKCGIRDEDIYVFDCVGRGTVPLLGLNVLPPGAPASFAKKFNALKQGVVGIFSSLGLNWVNLPMPYSDNAGFLANGFPAVAITMLPDSEAQTYMAALQAEPDLLRYVQNKDVPPNKTAALHDLLPYTWRLMHTDGDDLASLTPQSFGIIARILDAIALRKTM